MMTRIEGVRKIHRVKCELFCVYLRYQHTLKHEPYSLVLKSQFCIFIKALVLD